MNTELEVNITNILMMDLEGEWFSLVLMVFK